MGPMAALFVCVFSLALYSTEAYIPEHGYGDQIFRYIQAKRASNLGGRMCQLDSRNCAAFNVGKKFVGYSSWLRDGDVRNRRDYYYYKKPMLQNRFGAFRDSPSLYDRKY